MQGFHLNAQHLLIPARIECETVVCEDIGFLLRFCEVIHEYARNLLDVLCPCSHNAPVSCENAVVLVDYDGTDESELPQTAAQLVDLLGRMRPCVVGIRNEFTDRNELHLRCCFVQMTSLLTSSNAAAVPSDPPAAIR